MGAAGPVSRCVNKGLIWGPVCVRGYTCTWYMVHGTWCACKNAGDVSALCNI